MRVDRLLLLAATLGCAVAGAAELATLFHTADERGQLDRMRRGDPAVPGLAVPERRYAPEVTGFVKRSDGRNTVWIDGRALATSNPKNAPLFDPRFVRDLAPELPPDAIKVVPESRKPPPR